MAHIPDEILNNILEELSEEYNESALAARLYNILLTNTTLDKDDENE